MLEGSDGGRRSVAAPGVMLLVVAVAQMITLAALGWSSDYWYDDLFHLSEVHTGLGLSYHDLMLPVFGHMIPGFRLVFWLLEHVAPGHYHAALLLEVACCGASTLVLGRILRLISHRPLASALIASLLAVSMVQVATFTWFSQSLVAMPSTLFTLVATERFLVWRERRRWASLVWCMVTWGLALAFYEKAALLPLWLLALVGFVLPLRWSVRTAARALAECWPAWACFAGTGLLWLVAYHAGDYGSTVPKPSLGQLGGFIATAWFRNFWLSVVGARSLFGVPQGGFFLQATGQIVFLSLVCVTTLRFPPAWRAWAFFVGSFVLHIGLVGYGRAGWGSVLGQSSFYAYESGWLLAITLGAAVRRPEVDAMPAGAEIRPRPAWAGQRLSVSSELVAAGLALGLVVLIGVRDTRSAATTYRSYPGRAVHTWTENVIAGAALLRRDGRPFSVFDDKAPSVFTQNEYPATDRLSAVLGTGYVDLDYDDPARAQYLVDSSGHLVPAELKAQGRWRPKTGAGGGGTASECWTGPKRLALSHRVEGASLFLLLRTDQVSPVQVRLWTQAGGGAPAFATDTDGLVNLPGGSHETLVPLLPTSATSLYVNAPSDTQVCVDSIAVGAAQPTGSAE